MFRRVISLTCQSTRRRCFFNFSQPLKRVHQEEKIVPYSCEDFFDVVADVDNYKSFLPFCVDSRVNKRSNENVMEADLCVGFKVFTETYTSRIIMNRPNKISIKSIESPTFQRIESEWDILPGEKQGTSKVRFKVLFEVSSILHAQAIQLFFEDVARTQLTAFIKRVGEISKEHKSDTKKSKPPSAKLDATVNKHQKIPYDSSSSKWDRVPTFVQENMAQDEINEWKSTFNKYMNANHELDLKAFQSAWKDQSLMHKMPEHLNYSPVLAIAVFNGFKEQHRSLDDYNLTLYEFLSGVYLVLHGSLEDQANHLFDVIDTDRNGRIDRNELSRAMEQRIHSIARLMPDLLKEQLKELVETDIDAQSIKVVEKGVQDGMHALQHMMEDVEKDIPMAVNQIFLEADLNQTDDLSLDEWLLIWKVRPELIDMMSINGMMKIIRWASAVGVQRDNTGSSTSTKRRRPDTRMKGAD